MGAEIKRVWIVAITVLDKNANETATKYYTNGVGFSTKPADTPGDTHVAPRLIQPLQLTRSLFGIRTTRGRSVFTPGDIVLNNADGALDAFGDNWLVDGQTVTVYYGPQGFSSFPADFDVAFTGTMLDAEVSRTEVRIKVRDRQAALNIPLQTTKYAGSNTNGFGLEGEQDLAGKPKPVLYGSARNVPAVCVNAGKLIYQVNDGAVDSASVYDRGEELPEYEAFAIAAVGLNGELQTSNNGTAWTLQSPGLGTSTIVGIAYGQKRWVAVQSNAIWYSEDLLTWTQASSLTSAWTCVAYLGNRTWMAGGTTAANRLARSTDDGETWTVVVPLNNALGTTNRGVRSLLSLGNGQVIATSSTGVNGQTDVALSSDYGLSWTQLATGISGQFNYMVKTAADVVVAVGGVTTTPLIRTASLTDLTTWTARTVPASHTAGAYNGVAVDDTSGTIVATGRETSTNTGYIATSPTGTTWTAQTTAVDRLTQIVWDTENSQFVSVGGTTSTTGVIQTSPDGATWTSQTAASAQGLSAIFTGTGVASNQYANAAELEIDDLAPEDGTFKLYPAGGLFRLGSQPAGLVTADVIEGDTAADRTAAQIAQRIAEDRGGLVSGDFNAADITALDTANDAVVGFFTDAEMEVATALDQVLGSVGAAWFTDTTNDFRFQRFEHPSGTPDATFKATDLVRPLNRILSNDPQNGLPSYSTVIRWGKNYAPQPVDIADVVTQDRRNEIRAEWRSVEIPNTTIRDRHPLSPQIVDDSLLTDEDDATTEAYRRHALRDEKSFMFEVVVPLTDDNLAIELNGVVELIHDRYGLSIEGDDEFGGQFRVTEIAIDAAKETLSLVVWGRPPINRITSAGAYRVTSAGAYRVAA